ncbi:MAG: hypothetical protein O3C54_02690 [Proteobacteria bacterium]|nr:hypothetical protein [Pseudomonadota bacterium]
MKKLILFLIISVGLNAQFNYQAIVKDSDGNPVTNNGVSFRFSLMYQSSTATPVYVEEHTVTTPPDGVNNLSIGGGTVVNGIFSDIDWSQSVFMKEELDTGNGYQDMGSRKVTSVPVAEFAKNSGSSISSLTFVDSSNNLAIGTSVSLDGERNVAIGVTALADEISNAKYNVGIGYGALSNITSGTGNIAIGDSSLYLLNNGNNNLAIGDAALYNNLSDNNIGVGTISLANNVSGTQNIGIGTGALYYNKDGSYNVALGNLALTNNVSGSSNVSIGDASLYNSISSSNVGLGRGAGYYLNTENSNKNTFIGTNANTVSGTQINNSTAIGANSIVTTSNTIQLGDTNVTLINTSGTVSAASYKGSGDELEITVNGVITSLVSKILELEDKISSLESGSTSMNSSLTFLERYDGTFWEVYTNNTSGDTSINFIGIKNDPNGLFFEGIFIEEYSDLQRLGDCYQIVVGESTRYDSDGEREDFDVMIIENSSEKLIFELIIGYYDGESTIQEYDRSRVQLIINNNQLTMTVVDLDVTDTDVTTYQSSIYNYEDLCDNYNFLLNEYNYTNIPFEKYYDLETQSTCGSCDSGAYAQFDLRFSAGSGDIRARMSWNEQYTNVALVGDKSFDEVTYSDISNYYFCQHINDDNSACDNSDNPPTDFIGIYMTYEGNYYLVQYVSETDNDVKFKYKLLRQ